MNKKLISIIIPIFNVEDYLERCLDSILDQNVSDDIELICINDGSTDNSLSILENYKRDYPFITLISQTNIGLGATRNKAMKMATGKYLMFVDSDDWLEQGCFSTLIEYAKDLDSDFIEFETLVRNNKGELIKSYNTFNQEYTDYALENYLEKTNNLLITAWSKLWNREFIIKNHIFFEENTRWEDIEFSHAAFNLAQRVSNRKVIVYNYFLGQESITRTRMTNEYLNQFIKQRIIKNIYWEKNSKSQKVRELMKEELYYAKRRFLINILRGFINVSINWKWAYYLFKYYPLNKL
jgi:glycosyltransferase involved in cell wall biosynthesis